MQASEVTAYQCGICRRIRTLKFEAEQCCVCRDCGETGWLRGERCAKCNDARDGEESLSALEKAKIDEKGEVFFDEESGRMFYGPEEVVHYYKEMNPELTPPARLWVCVGEPLAFNVERMMRNEIDDSAFFSANIPPDDIERIQKIVDGYLKKWGVIGWQPGEYAIETQAILEASKD